MFNKLLLTFGIFDYVKTNFVNQSFSFTKHNLLIFSFLSFEKEEQT